MIVIPIEYLITHAQATLMKAWSVNPQTINEGHQQIMRMFGREVWWWM
jgi:hypothetical protein